MPLPSGRPCRRYPSITFVARKGQGITSHLPFIICDRYIEIDANFPAEFTTTAEEPRSQTKTARKRRRRRERRRECKRLQSKKNQQRSNQTSQST